MRRLILAAAFLVALPSRGWCPPSCFFNEYSCTLINYDPVMGTTYRCSYIDSRCTESLFDPNNCNHSWYARRGLTTGMQCVCQYDCGQEICGDCLTGTGKKPPDEVYDPKTRPVGQPPVNALRTWAQIKVLFR